MISETMPAKEPDPACADRVEYLQVPKGSLAHCHTHGQSPGVVFFGGYRSDMTGQKARRLEEWAVGRGYMMTRFDYRGQGRSSGRFVDGTIGEWLDDALAVLESVATGPQILVGSSMGAWIATLAALAQPGRVKGLVGIASAPDFSEDLLWPSLTPDQQDALRRNGEVRVESGDEGDPLPITRAFIEDGRDHLVLRAPIRLACPVRLIHGVEDPDVPWQTSVRLMEQVTSPDVQVTLVKDGEHRLSRPQDLELIVSIVEQMVERTTSAGDFSEFVP